MKFEQSWCLISPGDCISASADLKKYIWKSKALQPRVWFLTAFWPCRRQGVVISDRKDACLESAVVPLSICLVRSFGQSAVLLPEALFVPTISGTAI